MEYVDGGWNFSISGYKSVLGVPVGIYLTISGAVADMAWITEVFVAFAATKVATNDRANTTRFSTTKYLGI